MCPAGKSMKTALKNFHKNGEKHNLNNLFIALVDGHGRALWSSRDPGNEAGHVGQSILDVVVEDEREKALQAISRCLLEGQTVGYVVTMSTNQLLEKWRVTLMPARYHEVGLAVAVCSHLPENYAEFTEGDKEMLVGLCADKSLREIAVEMHRSESAIDSKIKALKAKLGCKTIGGLVATALRSRVI